MRGGAVGSPRWTRMSRTVGAAVMKAMMMHIAPAEVRHRTRIQPRATNRAPMHDEIEPPLPRRRRSALRKIDRLQRVCAVIRRRFPVGANPTRRTAPAGSTGATMEETKWLKPSVKRATIRWPRECAGRNASERRASLENADVQADPMTLSGKADIAGLMSDVVAPVAAPG